MRRPCSRLSSASAAPMRVPPAQSDDVLGGARQRAVRIAAGQLARDARQPRAEHERLYPRARGHTRLQVLQQHPRVRGHRARDVAHQHEPAAGARRARGSGARAARRRGAATRGRSRAGRGRRGAGASPACGARAAAARGGPAARAAPGRARARRRCTRRSPSRAAAPRRCRRPAPAASPSSTGCGSASRRDADAREHRPLDLPELLERVAGVVLDARRRRANASANSDEVGARRAQRGAQGEVGVARRGGVDRGQRAVGGQQLADADRARRRRACRAASCERRAVTAGSDTAEHSPLAHALDVLAHLQRDAERGLEVVGLAVEREQRPRPGDRLPDARQLVELLLAQPRDRRRTRGRRPPRARPAGARARSRPRARASGSRSSGTGSGA